MKTIPYENATSGNGAIEEIRKILNQLGCQRFGFMTDNEKGELLVQFTYRDREVSIAASYDGYAAAFLRAKPHSYRMRRGRVEYERDVKAQAQISVCSVLRDWIKGQIMAIECGILSFDGAFLGQILIPHTGKTVLEAVNEKKLLAIAQEAPQT